MPDRLYFTESDEANELIAGDPMALLVGFALDQQVTVQKAFSGPLALRERVGTLEPAALAGADLDGAFREKPAIHRFPGAMAKRVHDLAVHVERALRRRRGEGVDGRRPSTDELRANLAALPGFGEMKVELALRRAGEALRRRRSPSRSRRRIRRSATSTRRQALAEYQAAKRAPQGRVDGLPAPRLIALR